MTLQDGSGRWGYMFYWVQLWSRWQMTQISHMNLLSCEVSFFFCILMLTTSHPPVCTHLFLPALLCFLPLWLPDHFHLCVVPLHVYIFRPRPFLLSLACGLVRPRKLVFIEPLFWQSLTLSFAFVCDDAALWSMTYDLTKCATSVGLFLKLHPLSLLHVRTYLGQDLKATCVERQ